jgi:hypothetical protein
MCLKWSRFKGVPPEKALVKTDKSKQKCRVIPPSFDAAFLFLILLKFSTYGLYTKRLPFRKMFIAGDFRQIQPLL